MVINQGTTAATHSLVNGKLVYGMTEEQLQHVHGMDPLVVLDQRYPEIKTTGLPSQYFLAAADRRPRQDGITAYTVLRRLGYDAQGMDIVNDVTGFHPAHALFHLHELPEILYQKSEMPIDKVPGLWKNPPPLLDDNGNEKIDTGLRATAAARPKDEPLYDWETTPAIIGRNAHPWEIEHYCRLDPRHTQRSIMSLTFHADGGPRPWPNTINMLRCRLRTDWNMETWKNATSNKVQQRAADDAKNGRRFFTQTMINANSTRGRTPGLIDPSRPRSSMNWVSYPARQHKTTIRWGEQSKRTADDVKLDEADPKIEDKPVQDIRRSKRKALASSMLQDNSDQHEIEQEDGDHPNKKRKFESDKNDDLQASLEDFLPQSFPVAVAPYPTLFDTIDLGVQQHGFLRSQSSKFGIVYGDSSDQLTSLAMAPFPYQNFGETDYNEGIDFENGNFGWKPEDAYNETGQGEEYDIPEYNEQAEVSTTGFEAQEQEPNCMGQLPLDSRERFGWNDGLFMHPIRYNTSTQTYEKYEAGGGS